jgi:hypothetical protein
MFERLDDQALLAVRNVGIDVDKYELAKALQYDRNQYEKGKVDGIKELLIRIEKRILENYVQRQLDGIDGIMWSDIELSLREMGGRNR